MEGCILSEKKAGDAPNDMGKDSEPPKRIVIDEVIGGKYRILRSKMKTTATEDRFLDPSSWEDEEEHAIDEKELKEVLLGQDVGNFKEGRVFKIKAGRAENIHIEITQHVKDKTRRLLDREGNAHREDKGGRI